MKETETFTGMIVKKHRSFFGKCYLTLSDTRHIRKVQCNTALFEQLCEGMQLTIVRDGNQMLSWRPATDREEPFSPIAEIPNYQHGKPLYYRSSRCWNTEEVRSCNQGLLTGDELVSFDCCLFEQLPVLRREIEAPCAEHQYLAVIVEPEAQPSTIIAQDERFTFCGYDLVEEMTKISAITCCDGGFSDVIDYPSLNKWGLIRRYAEAKETQQRLLEAYPYEPHADCVIVEIWRYISE